MDFISETWDWNNHTIKDLSLQYIGWEWFFSRDDIKKELDSISTSLESYRPDIIYPEIENVFRVFRTPPENIKVVILGQDPYHNGNAVGLSFSVKNGEKINPSLKNIYKEASVGEKDQTGNLEILTKKGVFLLNTALTVLKGKPESHLDIWEVFSEKVVSYISERSKPVWLLMGAKAIRYKKYIQGGKIFCTSHPSPFSAHRALKVDGISVKPFLGSGVFRDIENEIGFKLF